MSTMTSDRLPCEARRPALYIQSWLDLRRREITWTICMRPKGTVPNSPMYPSASSTYQTRSCTTCLVF